MQFPSATAAVPEPASLLTWFGALLLALATRLQLKIGDQVKIIRGALAGLFGRAIGHTDAGRCHLTIDGLPPGTTVVIGQDGLLSLQNAADQSNQSAGGEYAVGGR